MGIGDRIRRSIRAWRGSGDDGALAGRLDTTYREQLALLQQVNRGVADLATNRKRVELQLAKLRQQATDLDDQARTFVAAGDDDSARAALTRKVAVDTAASDLGARHAALVADEAKLQQTSADLQRVVEEFRLRKDTLVARQSAASARAEIHRATTGIAASAGEVGHAMAEAEQHTRELQARADAVDELVAEGIIDGPADASGSATTNEAQRWERAFETADQQIEGGTRGQDQIQG